MSTTVYNHPYPINPNYQSNIYGSSNPGYFEPSAPLLIPPYNPEWLLQDEAIKAGNLDPSRVTYIPTRPIYSHEYLNRNTSFEKTDWVLDATLPQDSIISSYLHKVVNYVSSFFVSEDETTRTKHEDADLWIQAGLFRYQQNMKEMIADSEEISLELRNFLMVVGDANDLECFNMACSIESKNPIPFFFKAKAHFLREQYNDAVLAFSYALEKHDFLNNSSDTIARISGLFLACRGSAYERMGLYKEALQDYKEAYIKDNSDPNHVTGIERVYRGLLDKSDKTIDDIQACIDFEPDNPSNRLDMAEWYLSCNDMPRAVPYLNHASELSLQNPSQLYRLAEIYYQLGWLFIG